MPRITKKLVEAAEPNGRDYFLWCDDLPGFGVRVFASGRCSYLVQYRSGGRSRRVTIGLHGALTADEARREAKSLLGQVARGEDPAEERATRRGSMTIAELCEAYLEATEKGLIMGKGGRAKKASTLYVDRGRIERHIKPLLGRRLVVELTQPDVQRFVRDVQAGKTAAVVKTGFRGKAVVEGGPGTAARTVGLLGGILSFAIGERVIAVNPAAGVKRPADRRRTRRLSPEEYGILGRALVEAEENRAEQWQTLAGIRLLMLTGCRLGEIARLRWSEVDADGSCLRLEDTKERESVRPLGKPTLAILAALPRAPGARYVLPAIRGSGAIASLDDALERITARVGIEGVTAHTLRHSFASTAGDLGYSESTIGAMIGHAGHSITSRYIHHLDVVLIAAADRVSKVILSITDHAVY